VTFGPGLVEQIGRESGDRPRVRGMWIDRYDLTDLWACGILLHRLICGRHLLSSLDGNPLFYTAMLDLPMPSMRDAAPPEVPVGLVEVVDRCLFMLKAQRWQSADDLLAALLPFLPGGPALAGPAALPTDVQVQDKRVVQGASCDAHGHVSALPTAASQSRALPQAKHTILCLAADSTGADGSIQLGRQASAIRKELECSGARDRFEVVTQLAAEPMDLLRVFRKLKPTVVYFVSSGQETAEYRYGQALVGDRFGGLFFRGRGGRPQFLSPSAVEETFGAAGRSVRLVVMSGCYVDLQAAALLSHVDCVVGTRGTVQPEVALVYAIGFMGALGDHESIAAAHKQACAAISLEGLGGGDAPQLKVRQGVDPGRIVLAAEPCRR
jgi:hypothetical protein